MPARLKSLTLKGFKSIRELTDFELGPINVLIGANGAGKSNFISFFRLLAWMTGGPNLQVHVSALGGASALLHDGAGKTKEIQAELILETDQGENDYHFRLFFAAGDILIFADERYRFSRMPSPTRASWHELGAGHREANVVNAEDPTSRVILYLLRKCIVYQFHNTSPTSNMRIKWHVEENRWLKEDGGNLGPFLLRLRDSEPKYYRRIVETIRLVVPFFSDFELEPEKNFILLKWKEIGSDMVFNASQASDGMLRAMALIALLGQPENDLPNILILDEPELGQHPQAINIIVGMLRAVSRHVQIILATQSMTLLDYFEPEEIVVVDRKGRESTFQRLDPKQFQEWRDEYTMAELFEKNVFGGWPAK